MCRCIGPRRGVGLERSRASSGIIETTGRTPTGSPRPVFVSGDATSDLVHVARRLVMGTAQAVPAATPIEQRGYAHPEVLVSTDWVAQHLNDPKVRLVESNEDILLYDTGHIPGAVKIDWTTDLNDQLIRDYVDRSRLQALLRSQRDQRRHHDRLLRRQEQLVGHLRALGAPALRRHEREDPRRRTAPLGGRGPEALDRHAELSGGEHHGRRAERPADPRLPRRRARRT